MDRLTEPQRRALYWINQGWDPDSRIDVLRRLVAWKLIQKTAGYADGAHWEITPAGERALDAS